MSSNMLVRRAAAAAAHGSRQQQQQQQQQQHDMDIMTPPPGGAAAAAAAAQVSSSIMASSFSTPSSSPSRTIPDNFHSNHHHYYYDDSFQKRWKENNGPRPWKLKDWFYHFCWRLDTLLFQRKLLSRPKLYHTHNNNNNNSLHYFQQQQQQQQHGENANSLSWSRKKGLFCLLFLLTFLVSIRHSNFRSLPQQQQQQQGTNHFVVRRLVQQTTPITIQQYHHHQVQQQQQQQQQQPSRLYLPSALNAEYKERSKMMDYGGLYVYIFEEDGVARSIFRDYKLEETVIAAPILQRNRQHRDDDVTDYYAFDDDVSRNQYLSYPGDSMAPERQCRRTNWHRLVFPTCNLVHELSMESVSDSQTSYLSYGAYRDVFTVNHHYSNYTDKMVIKQYRQDLDAGYDSYEYVRMDALVSERLTASPRTADIYSHCALAIVAEFFRYGDSESLIVPTYKQTLKLLKTSNNNNNSSSSNNNNNNDTTNTNNNNNKVTQNNLSNTAKLRIALDMAEAIADLHGFEDGVIVHNDIQPSQFLFVTEDRQELKLNDFNRAEVMLWDEEHQEYCRYRSGHGRGNYRSPEEYLDLPLNEKIDVWSLGNNFYALLTGRYIFHELNTDDEAKRSVRHGVWPSLDPRYRTSSFAESVLVELMERCWAYEPDDRIDIFEIVARLREAVAENERMMEQERRRHANSKNNVNNKKNNIKNHI